ncbi:MAG: carotenoid biosynthesis protein [Actinomycetales bacterium]
MTPPPSRSRRLLTGSAALAGATVLLQIAYPLTSDRQLGRLSVVTVVVACGACVVHALAEWGPVPTVAFTAVVVGGAFAVEALGVATGFPFGHYMYAHSLGPLLLGVPLLVPLAWLMMAYPCLLLSIELAPNIVAPQRLLATTAVSALLGGGAMAAWDLFLDPQMVAAGHWTWRDPTPALPGVERVPLTNLAGWLLSATVLMAVSTALLQRLGTWAVTGPLARHPDNRLSSATPMILLGWAWLGGIVANAVFFDRAAIAGWGGLLLGVLVLPYLVSVLVSVGVR